MRTRAQSVLVLICLLSLVGPAMAIAQNAGDFRTHQTGSWNNVNTWERYDGALWVYPAAITPVDTLGRIDVLSGHTVNVTANVAADSVWVHGTLIIDAGITFTANPPSLNLERYGIFADSGGTVIVNGTYRHNRNGGSLPVATWNDGSTLLVTGITTSTSVGGNGIQSFYNIAWNCPNQTANSNLGWHPPSATTTFDTSVTIRGNITVLSTGLARAYMCGIRAGTALVPNNTHITVNGNISVSNRATFTAHGTSSNYTNVYVTVLGNIAVRDSGSQLSISRGSQGGTGTTTWYIKSDSVYYGPYTNNQNSTDPNTGITSKGKFIFCKAGTQVVTLDSLVNWTGPCNMQFGDSVTNTTVNIGNSPFIGSACVQRIKYNATVITGADGYIGGGTNTNSFASTFAMDAGATLVLASQNGIKATGTGSSGAVRVAGNRDYGTAANFEYNGIADQRLGSGFPTSANNLTINNAAGVYVDSVAAFAVNGMLSVLNGDLDLNGCVITLGPSGLLSETAGNTVTGTSGVITTTRTLTAPSVSTDIAGLGIKIGSSADLGSTVITRGHAVQTAGGGSVKRYFDLTPTTNTGLNATLVYRYDDSELNSLLESNLILFKSSDNGASWSQGGGIVNTTANTVTVSGIDGLSRWTASTTFNGFISVAYSNGWNLISNPVVVANDSVRVLFPQASFPYAFWFNPTGGYVQSYRMLHGLGYWEKFPTTGSASVSGSVRTSDTVSVSQGWNTLGSITFPVDTSAVVTVPSGIRASVYFAYSGGYSATQVIQPGKAYWVKANAAGTFILSSSGSRPSATQSTYGSGNPAGQLARFSNVTITDATGASQTLYIGADGGDAFPVAMYEMPPVGPEGIFDVRFESQRMVEVYGRDNAARYPIQLSSPVYPLTVSWNVTGADQAFTLTDGVSTERRISGVGQTTIHNSAVKHLVLGTQTSGTPTVFSLHQNFPNPFNPSTQIKFSVENTGRATLDVFNLLGQKVATLFDGIAETGKYYDVKFSAPQLSSGVYFYRLQSGKKSDMKKLMLLK